MIQYIFFHINKYYGAWLVYLCKVNQAHHIGIQQYIQVQYNITGSYILNAVNHTVLHKERRPTFNNKNVIAKCQLNCNYVW